MVHSATLGYFSSSSFSGLEKFYNVSNFRRALVPLALGDIRLSFTRGSNMNTGFLTDIAQIGATGIGREFPGDI